ncbi:DUF4082 domain-containing protein [Cellulomonas fimi]|uniref:DUF4082 domain-containing protein n=1 Tax=Cellulomonas fimi TaxID=1708 RepID=A0A7Y0M064_CELFI|nr:DUF4082 domain-containing protein [Cellulomonas fimi]NMR21432.1 DUF4082 domain-containing protein [Cellulomonas fimi]
MTPTYRPSVRGALTALVGILALLASLLVGLPAPATAASDPCGVGGNPIACENSKPGANRSEWDIRGAGDPSIQGFATEISVNVGEQVDFKIDTDAAAYSIDIYRTGWYGGKGARKVASVVPSATLPQMQPECLTEVTTGLYDCGTWGVSASWQVPADAVSGVYVALLTRGDDTGGGSHITFVVRNDASTSDMVFQTSDTTWQAYNTYGGTSFYRGASSSRGYALSYNRPFATREGVTARDFYFSAEYPMVRFLEQNGYDVTYQAGADTDRRGDLLLNHKVFLSVGHDEYWTGPQRANVEAARDAGVNLAFFSGNEMYWRARWAGSADGTSTPYRTLVSYKETFASRKIDPSSEWTGTWRDPRFAPTSAGGNMPENALTGTLYMSNFSDLPVTVSAEEGRLRLWRSTSLASLPAGTSQELARTTVGYESNEDRDNGARPPGLIRLSTTTGPVPEYLLDYGNTVAPGTTVHNTTLYRAASGALVFSAGSIQWTWGLDATHDGDGPAADPRMRQAPINLFADMGVQPATLAPDLAPATASTDTTGPTTTVTSPAAGTSVANGTPVTVTGTASDVGGGRVAGVEVSTDGGATWHPATGTTAWSYTYRQVGLGDVEVQVRAVDDSARTGSAAVLPLIATCPCSAFGTDVPATPSVADASSVELGLRFSTDRDGFATGVRFYKGEGNTGTHTGSLWDAAGQRLSTVTFTDETATGWQEAAFPQSVRLVAGQTYVVSYTAPAGRYAGVIDYFSAAGANAPPIITTGGFGTQQSGVFGNAGTFPSRTYRATNYFVDVVFDVQDTAPLRVVDRTPLDGSTSVPLGSSVTAVFSRAAATGSAAVTLADPAGQVVTGTTTYDDAARRVTFTPTAGALTNGVTYTATVTATDLRGEPLVGAAPWSFTTALAPSTPGVCPCSLYDDTDQPNVLEVTDTAAVTLGVRFTSAVAGNVTGVRFYKGPGNTGSHVGSLWSAAGERLASATFSAESTSGWQTVTFPTPVAVAPGTQYVATYRAPAGRYSTTPNAYGSAFTREPLTVPQSGGVFVYADAFPTLSTSSSYLVDVVFERAATEPPAVVSRTPAPGAMGVDPASTISATFSRPVAAGAQVGVQESGQAVAGATAWSEDGRTVTFTPSAAMAGGATHSVSVTGIRSTDGVSAAPVTWTFTTAGTGTCPCTLFAEQVPAVPASTDSSATELGLAFVPATDGEVMGVRFYKGAGNGGTHTGSLWSATGTRLATVTFTDETATGWQSAAFAAPVSVQAGQTYVVSYFAPQGRYAAARSYFATTAWTRGPLTAPAGNNGRYVYGGGFPTRSWSSTNYYVDVMFRSVAATPPTVTAVSPAAGATGVSRSTAVTATLSRVPAAGTPTLALTTDAGPVAGASSFDAGTRTLRFTPSAAMPGETVVSAVASLDGTAIEGGTWQFTTAPEPVAGQCPCSLWTDADTPAVPASTDSSATELGLAFVPATDGEVMGVRFYKGAGNGGTHTGSLWSATGTRLATVTFTDETATGWQSAAFAAPVSVQAGQTYVVSYFAPQGRYAAARSYFATTAWTRGPLTAPAGNNGRYVYGGGFPTRSWSSTNYYVDVMFRSVAATPPTVTAVSPAAGATGVSRSTAVTATLSRVPAAGTPTLALTTDAGPVAGASSFDAGTRTLRFTPSAAMPGETVVSAVASLDGTAIEGGTWQFTTAPEPVAGQCPCSLWTDADTPVYSAWNDTKAVQVGVRFTAAVNGEVTAIRFYKGSTNTGTHTVALWGPDGTRLASAPSSSETGSGWQTVTLPTPVPVAAGQVYTAAYHSTTGRYSLTVNGLAGSRVNGPLSTGATAGAYVYGTGFPAMSSSSNYWVDVAFTPTG